MTYLHARQALRRHADAQKAKLLQRYFKTGPGEYGEGDRFIGVVVPSVRKVVREFKNLPLTNVLSLLKSKIHEERLLALLILVEQFKKADDQKKKKLFDFYMRHLAWVNNWDLVDLSARDISGAFLEKRDREVLYRLARSKRLWDRRVAVLSTGHFIRCGEVGETLRMARFLLQDQEDLMHKAVGWMLREAGKRDKVALEGFLREHRQEMPRTMLRYAIERFPENQRQRILKGE